MFLGNIQFLVQYLNISHLPMIRTDWYIFINYNSEKKKRHQTWFGNFASLTDITGKPISRHKYLKDLTLLISIISKLVLMTSRNAEA